MKTDETFEFGYRHGRQMHHFLVDVTAYGSSALVQALCVAFIRIGSQEKHATHFRADGHRQLTLFAGPLKGLDKPPGLEAFPQPMARQRATFFVWDWLKGVEYPSDNEYDGHP